MTTAVLAQSLVEPQRVSELTLQNTPAVEKINPKSDNWAFVYTGEQATVTLDPSALIIIRSQSSAPIAVGHFLHANQLPANFEQMLRISADIFATERGVRVDCFGVSDIPGRWDNLKPSAAQDTKDFILEKLRESGFNRIFTHWTYPGMVQDVSIIGDTRHVEFCEYWPNTYF